MKPPNPHTVKSIADFLLDVNDDVLPERYYEANWDIATEKEYVDLFQRVYLHGSCAEFAYALHRKYQWPIVQLWNGNFKLHYACQTPDGAFFDASGPTTLAAIKKRYRFGKTIQPKLVDPQECLPDLDDDEEPDLWSATSEAAFVIEYLRY